MQATRPILLIAHAILPMVLVLTASSPVLADPGADGALTPAEAAYDCKKINGRMQILILQIRDYPARDKGSMLARGLQSVTVPIFGGTRTGLDPDGQYQRDVQKLQAFNARLAQLKCPTFDLEAELSTQDVRHTPRPQQNK